MDNNKMNEREELLAKIADCSEAMSKVKSYEDRVTDLQDKKKKVKSVGTFILMAVLFLLVALLLPLPEGANVVFGILAPILGPAVIIDILVKKLGNEIDKYANMLVDAQSDESLSWLPPVYRSFVSYSYIASYIQNMRANNLQEAINLFETEKHRATLEYLAAQSSTTTF